MSGLKDTDPDFCAADRLMHELWTKDVGSPSYDKRKWQALEAAILALARRSTNRRPNAHEPLDNCPNNAAIMRHDAEIKALQRQGKARDE